MAKCGYKVQTGTEVSLTGGTAKTVLGVMSGAAFGIDLKKFRVSFGETSASAEPAVVELAYCTFATNPPGTNSTSVTPFQVYGRAITHGITAARNWTTEPTVVSSLDEFFVTPAAGNWADDLPLGDTPDSAVSEGFVIRVNVPADAGVRAAFWFERC